VNFVALWDSLAFLNVLLEDLNVSSQDEDSIGQNHNRIISRKKKELQYTPKDMQLRAEIILLTIYIGIC
jgi:hypothetical protein